MVGYPIMHTVTLLTPISLADLREMSTARFGDLVKAVVDLERRLMAVDAEMHSARRRNSSRMGPASKISGASTCIPTFPKQIGWSSIR